ncbi:hypothetical protein, partial [Brevibacterium sp. S22]|uniref:hypothetical protein n=1 Tax=Brevibacterium sp. S22 TaxID=2483794 RepID=UPI00197AF011
QDQTLHKKIMLQYESQQDSQPLTGVRRLTKKNDHTPTTPTTMNGSAKNHPHRMNRMPDRVIVSPEIIKCSGITTCSNKHAIGFSNHKHTPITTPHKQACSLGVSASLCVTHPES